MLYKKYPVGEPTTIAVRRSLTMAKQKIFGIMESVSVLLEPVSEKRYYVQREMQSDLAGSWVTVAGNVQDSTIVDAEVVSVEKNAGKATRAGTIVAEAPNLPPEATGQGGYLYQQKKGRYLLLSTGKPGEPVQGNFSQYVGQEVKASGEFGDASYILYNVKISTK
jgi:hypothetical protein